jgi:hypothetical protein
MMETTMTPAIWTAFRMRPTDTENFEAVAAAMRVDPLHPLVTTTNVLRTALRLAAASLPTAPTSGLVTSLSATPTPSVAASLPAAAVS